MKNITMTEAQAEIFAGGDQPRSDPIASSLRREAQAIANATGQTCEIYHPEGYVWDARSPE